MMVIGIPLVGSPPKPGCNGLSLPIFSTYASECASFFAVVIGVFHALSAGKIGHPEIWGPAVSTFRIGCAAAATVSVPALFNRHASTSTATIDTDTAVTTHHLYLPLP